MARAFAASNGATANGGALAEGEAEGGFAGTVFVVPFVSSTLATVLPSLKTSTDEPSGTC